MQTEDKIWLAGILIDTIGEEYDKMIQLAISEMAPLTGLSSIVGHLQQVQIILDNMNNGDFSEFGYIEHLSRDVYDVGYVSDAEDWDDIEYINLIL